MTQAAGIEAAATSGDQPRVFISYARADASDFAEYLAAALKFSGFDAYLDRHDIAKAEDWETRLGDLIAKSDTVVFIITPESVNSMRCDWEIKRTAELRKRLVPVQWIPVPEVEVPVELKRLNYTIFKTGESFSPPLAELVDALRQDLHWLRQQTQLNEQAERWHGRERDPDFLLRGTEMTEARAWLQQRKPDAPELSPVLNAYIGASEEAEQERLSETHRRLVEREQASRRLIRRTVAGLVTALLLAAIAIGLGIYAKIQERNALAAKADAENSAAAAQAAKTEVDNMIRRINVGRSHKSGLQAAAKICAEAIDVTSKLVTTSNDRYRERFYGLYYGEMNLLELWQRTESYRGKAGDRLATSRIESAMVNFEQTLRGANTDRTLTQRAEDIESECSAFLSKMRSEARSLLDPIGGGS